MTDDLPQLPLGLRPPLGKPTLKVGTFLRVPSAPLPPVPPSVDHLTGVYGWEMGRNTEFGTCGPTSLANLTRMVTGKLAGSQHNPTWSDIATLYRRQNPDFSEAWPGGPGDQGVEMATMLSDAVKHGFGETRVLGFAEVDVADEVEVQAAIAIFGGLLVGVMMTQAQMQQLYSGVWRQVPGSPDTGGHAIMVGAYTPDGEDCITWQRRVRMTLDFLRGQRFQAFVVILEEHLGSRRFLDEFDLPAFAAAYETITERPFPAPVTPAPTHGPEPAQGACSAACEALAAVARSWVEKRRRGENRALQTALQAWLKGTGRG